MCVCVHRDENMCVCAGDKGMNTCECVCRGQRNKNL